MTKCYLFFDIGECTTLREQILRQGSHRTPFTEEELLKGVEDLIKGLLWLRYLQETHENINSLNIYCRELPESVSIPSDNASSETSSAPTANSPSSPFANTPSFSCFLLADPLMSPSTS